MAVKQEQHHEGKDQNEEDRCEDNDHYSRARLTWAQTTGHNGISNWIGNWALLDFICSATLGAGALCITRLMDDDSAVEAALSFFSKYDLAATDGACAAGDFHADLTIIPG